MQKISGAKTRIFRLKHGSKLVDYLYSEGLVAKEPEPHEDYLEFRVTLTDEQLGRLKSYMKSAGKKILKQ